MLSVYLKRVNVNYLLILRVSQESLLLDETHKTLYNESVLSFFYPWQVSPICMHIIDELCLQCQSEI